MRDNRIEFYKNIADSNARYLCYLIYSHENGLPVTVNDYADLPIVSGALNPTEQKLFNEDPILGARVLLVARSATQASSELYEDSVLHNDNGDAFRHFYWNYLMGSNSNIGLIWAERWANAHEDGASGQPTLERTMDLHNNLRGRQAASNGVDDDPNALRSAIRNGSCRVIRAGALVRSDRSGEI